MDVIVAIAIKGATEALRLAVVNTWCPDRQAHPPVVNIGSDKGPRGKDNLQSEWQQTMRLLKEHFTMFVNNKCSETSTTTDLTQAPHKNVCAWCCAARNASKSGYLYLDFFDFRNRSCKYFLNHSVFVKCHGGVCLVVVPFQNSSLFGS